MQLREQRGEDKLGQGGIAAVYDWPGDLNIGTK